MTFPKSIQITFIALFLSAHSIAQPITDRIEYVVTIRQDEPSESEWYRDNINPSGRRSWLERVIGDVRSGKLKAYHANAEKYDTPLSTSEVSGILAKTDTVYVESPEPPYDIEQVVVINEVDVADITRVKFREKWTWDKKKGLIKEVVAFAPMKTFRDPMTGEVRGWGPLFWVKRD